MNRITRALSLSLVLSLLAGCRPDSPAGPGREQSASSVEPVAVEPFAMGKPDVVLLVTGATNGRLEICSCSTMPGGLSGRSGLFRSYEAAYPRTVRIDTGDSFWVNPLDVRNEFIARGFRMLGYDAVVLGDQEWSVGPARLERILEAGPAEYLSTTIHPAAGGADLPIRPSVTREWGGLKLAVVSDVPKDSAFVPGDAADKIAFAPEGAAARAIDQLKDRGYAVVLVTHARDESAERTAQNSRADLVLRGHVFRSDGNLLSTGGKPLVKVGGADYVGVVALKLAGGKITALEYRLEPLDARWPFDERMVDLFKAYGHADAAASLDANRTEPIEYVASSQCGRCHAKQYEFWKTTGHASAYETLAKAKAGRDMNCVVCHVTGLGQAGGFESMTKTPQLANVNCQDCHRFNVAEHRKKGFRVDPVSRAACETCHTPLSDTSMEMRYEEMRKEVSCPKG
jgi:2',3'-cyclic-nucleotide 2'-phosphodiesterase (5'-nucleotidase family)